MLTSHAERSRRSAALFSLIADGALHVEIAKTFALADVADAKPTMAQAAIVYLLATFIQISQKYDGSLCQDCR